MDRKSSKHLIQQSIQSLDPYQLISILNKKIKSQSQSIEWYKKMYQTSQYQKKLTINELKKKKQLIQTLKIQWSQQKQQKKDYQLQLEQIRNKLNKIERTTNTTNINNNTYLHRPTSITNLGLVKSHVVSPYSRNNLLLSSKQSIPAAINNNNLKSTKFSSKIMFDNNKQVSTQLSIEMKSSDIYNFFSGPNTKTSISRVLQQKNANYLQQQFIPCDVKFINGQKHFVAHSSQSLLNISSQMANNQNAQDVISQRPGQFLVEDFLIFGPYISDLKKKRDEDRNAEILTVKPAILYAGNHRASNQHVYTEIAMRCFPFNVTAKRQLIESYDELKNTIEYFPKPKISSDCLILNLKGQVSQISKHNPCFRRSNLSEMEFIVCLKVPEFVLIAKDQRHYQRTQQQVWLVDKYYAIVTYFPFFDIHLNILSKIHSLMQKQKLNKIHIDKEKFFTFDIKRNMAELQRSQQAKNIVQYFKSYKPQFENVLFFKGHYYGTIPDQKQAEFYIAKMTAPVFMTNFCFEQMLLLLTGVFCEKSIAFISKNQGTATLCALFLIGIISPFPYSFSVLLNVDQQKICPFVFQYPFPMISTIKKTSDNLHQIIMSYATSRIQKKGIKQESQRMILVDIDTNSIFYQGHQTFQPLIFMGHPGQQFMREYMKINPSFSKSFSFPKKMDARKQIQQFNKRQQQRNKIIEDIEQTIKSNTMKMPSFTMTEQINKTFLMLLNYVRSFALQGKELFEALQELQSGRYQIILKKYLLERHPTKGELLQKIVNSQYYADYLNMYAQQ